MSAFYLVLAVISALGILAGAADDKKSAGLRVATVISGCVFTVALAYAAYKL